MPLSAQDYRQIAAALCRAKAPREAIKAIAQELALEFERSNRKFDYHKFMAAALPPPPRVLPAPDPDGVRRIAARGGHIQGNSRFRQHDTLESMGF